MTRQLTVSCTAKNILSRGEKYYRVEQTQFYGVKMISKIQLIGNKEVTLFVKLNR